MRLRLRPQRTHCLRCARQVEVMYMGETLGSNPRAVVHILDGKTARWHRRRQRQGFYLRQRGQVCCIRCFLVRSEEHTSELQSRPHLVCRLLLEKKKKQKNKRH